MKTSNLNFRTLREVILFSLFSFAFISCGGNQSNQHEMSGTDMIPEGIAIEEAWARPGMNGGMSAAYFRISNGGSETDYLVNAISDIAELTEIHESYQADGGMMGMRKVERVEVPSMSSVMFQQGGLHVMFIQLNRDLTAGDTIDLTLEFASGESQVVSVPIGRP